MRPIYLMISFWGERFRSYFTNYCLPSLLSPQNLELLSVEDGHKFLICTTENDWREFQAHPIFNELSRHVEPILIEVGLPADESDTAKFSHMTYTHQLMMDVVHQNRALACQIMPDTMYSDGTLSTVLRHASAGAHAVLAVALRMSEEKLFPELRRSGLLPAEGPLSSLPSRIVLPPRAAVGSAVRSLSQDLLNFDWDAKDFPPQFPAFCFWRVADKDEILIHSSYFAYLLIDFAAIETHNTQSFDVGHSIENIWLSDNFPDPSKVKVLQDSDEAMLLSWAPTPNLISPRDQQASLRIPLLSTLWKGLRLRYLWALHVTVGDVQKTNNFRYPIRLHSGMLGPEWQATEARTRRIIFWFFGDIYKEFNDLSQGDPLRLLMRIWWSGLRLTIQSLPLLERWKLRFSATSTTIRGIIKIIVWRVILALSGNAMALRWWGWRLRKLRAGLVGQPFHEPRPPAP